MLYILIGFGFGAFILFMMIKDYLAVDKKTKELLVAHPRMTKTADTKGILLTCVVLIICGLIAFVVKDPEMNNDVTPALGVVIIFMAIGQYFSGIYANTYYTDDQGIILNGIYIRYKSMKSITTIKSLMRKANKLMTFNGEEHILTSVTYKFLKDKVKK